MSKLSKVQARNHAEACKLLRKDTLTLDEKLFVLEHWREDATHINSLAGAFFTPQALARDLFIEVPGPRVIDLCAGIGSLAFAVWHHHDFGRKALTHITCVELNAEYVAVGRKILPEALWVQADVFALPENLALIENGHFDCAIANPPFGPVKAAAKTGRFTGNIFEYRVIDVASDIADYGVFIVPQMSAPFEFSGKQHYERIESDRYRRFVSETLIDLEANCGLDTSVHRADWTIIPPPLEIVTADFRQARAARELVANPLLPGEPLSDQSGPIALSNERSAGQLDLF